MIFEKYYFFKNLAIYGAENLQKGVRMWETFLAKKDRVPRKNPQQIFRKNIGVEF